MHTQIVEEDIGDQFPDFMKSKGFKLIVEQPLDTEDEVDRFNLVLVANKSNEKALWATDINQVSNYTENVRYATYFTTTVHIFSVVSEFDPA